MLQKEDQILMRIESIFLCRFYHRINLHTGIRSGGRITEEPVLTTYYQWTDTVLAEIIAKTAGTVFQIVHHKRTTAIGIVDCLDDTVS